MEIFTMDAFYWIERHGETLGAGLFLTLFGILAVTEAIAPARREPATRRRRWLHNGVLTALVIASPAALPMTSVLVAGYAARHGVGLLHADPVHWTLALGLTVLARSLVSYVVHVCNHHVPLFWRFHRVHHADPVLDVSTTVRGHPVEFLAMAIPNWAVVMALGLPVWALLVYELLDIGLNLLIHANVRYPAGVEAVVRQVFATPSLHAVHHSVRPEDANTNYGPVFSFWDRLFGTLKIKDMRDEPLGIDRWRDPRQQTFWWALVSPLVPDANPTQPDPAPRLDEPCPPRPRRSPTAT